jgi:integrase
MSVRKRTWTTAKGETKEAWIVDYVDQEGDRHIETFDLKKDADTYHDEVRINVRNGTHTAPSKSLTVAEAAQAWIDFVRLEDRERSTVAYYQSHVDLHINPRLGKEKLSKLTAPRIQAFRDDLLASLSRAQARKVLVSLKSLLGDARRRGTVAQNVAEGVSVKAGTRGKKKLRAGVDIPTPDEIRAILHAAAGRARPILVTAVFTGMRSSELRGLRWEDVDLGQGEVHVRQRADRFGQIGKLKTESGERTIPIGPNVVNTLREWKLVCPRGDLDLVFPNGKGKLWDHVHIVEGFLQPTLVKAGVVDAAGNAKYPGLHTLRHFYASYCINRRKDGGLELPIKTVQERMGHASITITSDVYGHLFPRTDDGKEMAEAEKMLFAVN